MLFYGGSTEANRYNRSTESWSVFAFPFCTVSPRVLLLPYFFAHSHPTSLTWPHESDVCWDLGTNYIFIDYYN